MTDDDGVIGVMVWIRMMLKMMVTTSIMVHSDIGGS